MEQIGTPQEVYNNSVNKFVAGFIGSLFADIRSADSCLHDGDNIFLMCPRGKLGYYAAVVLVHGLRGNDVRQHAVVGEDGSRCVVARRLYAEYYDGLVFCR